MRCNGYTVLQLYKIKHRLQARGCTHKHKAKRGSKQTESTGIV